MNPSDTKILTEFASQVRALIPQTCGIWAFGSRARGDASEASDLDVCIVVESLTPNVRRKIRDIAWQVGFDNDVVIATVKYDRKSFQEGPCAFSPLVRRIRTEGVAA